MANDGKGSRGSSAYTLVETTMNTFIVFTLFQIGCFICYPALFGAAAGEMDRNPWVAFRCVGAAAL